MNHKDSLYDYVRAKIIKLIDANIEINLCDVGLVNDFLSYNTKSTSNKGKVLLVVLLGGGR